MTWQFDVNNPETTAADGIGAAWRGLVDLLVANSWVIQGSGDGNAIFENTGDTGGPYDVHTGGATTWPEAGANTFSATEAWVRIKEPGASTREYVFQRSNTVSAAGEADITIIQAPAGFADTGIADANTPPTGADQQTIFSGAWGNHNADIRWHAGCEDAAVNGTYAWYVFSTIQSTGLVSGVSWHEPVNNIVVGDPEPWVAFATSTLPTVAVYASVTTGAQGWRDFGGGGEQFNYMPAHTINIGNNVSLPGIGAQADGDERHVAPIYGNLSIAAFKGTGANFRWRGTARDYPNTIDLAGADPRIYCGDLTLPWLQNEVPL